jgi:hypothetical protein
MSVETKKNVTIGEHQRKTALFYVPAILADIKEAQEKRGDSSVTWVVPDKLVKGPNGGERIIDAICEMLKEEGIDAKRTAAPCGCDFGCSNCGKRLALCFYWG